MSSEHFNDAVMTLKTMSLLLVPFALGILPSLVLADTPGGDKERAKSFFDQGIQKIHEGKCEDSPVGEPQKCRDARELFSRAHDIDPDALGILRNLAQIEEHLGLLTSAARHYRDLAAKAPHDPKPERRAWADLAKTALTTLQPRLAHLTITVASPPPDTQLKLDGEAVASASWGVPLEIDAGPHTVVAQAPGRPAFETRLELSEGGGRTVQVEIPAPANTKPAAPPPATAPTATAAAATAAAATAPAATAAAVTAPTAPPGAAAASPGAATAPAAATTSRAASTASLSAVTTHQQVMKVAPWVLVGAGGVALGVASALGIAAMNQYNTACPANASTCNLGEYDKGAGWADASTALFIVGGAALAGGLVWRFVLPSGPKDSAPRTGALVPAVGPGSLGIRGYFE